MQQAEQVAHAVDVFFRLVRGNRNFHRRQLEEYVRCRLDVQCLPDHLLVEAHRYASVLGARPDPQHPGEYLLPIKRKRKTRCTRTGDLFGGK